jgi:D-psicose/D-tagatose/L-ribulose 3-epimerase
MSRPVGIEVFYWLNDWSDDQASVFGKVADAGYDGAEISIVAGMQLDTNRIAAAAAHAGIQILTSTGLSPVADVSSSDAGIRAAGKEHLRRCLNQAAELGSPILGGVTYAPWMLLPEGDLAERRKWSAEALHGLGDEASALGVDICLEVLNRFETFMFNTVADCLAFIGRIEHPAFKVQVDTFHMNMEEDDLAAAVRLAGGRLGHVQVAANNRKGPQFGHIDWAAIRGALDAIGYDRWVVFETFPNPDVATGRDTRAWRSLAGDLDRDAADAAAFIRGHLA